MGNYRIVIESEEFPAGPPSYMIMYKNGTWTFTRPSNEATIFDNYKAASTQSEWATAKLIAQDNFHHTTYVEAYRPEFGEWERIEPLGIAKVISDLVST